MNDLKNTVAGIIIGAIGMFIYSNNPSVEKQLSKANAEIESLRYQFNQCKLLYVGQ